MVNIGLKIWSINTDVIDKIRDLYAKNMFQYVELYFVPDTLQNVQSQWSLLKEIPFVIHAPHFGHGFNLADKDLRVSNGRIMKDVFKCADILKTDTIIVHGGNGGSQEETITQLKLLHDCRFLIENKPKLGLNGKECIGYSPEGIAEIMHSCGLRGFVLDFNHAVCAANSLGFDPMEFIKKFSLMKPQMYHISDGDHFSLVDQHLNLGKGTMPLKEFVQEIFEGVKVTLETPNDFTKNFNDFEEDRNFLLSKQCAL